MTIMNTDPGRDWAGSELARQLQVKPRNMLTQLAEWARLGFLTRTGQGTYALNTPAADTSSTSAASP
jgi:DNA-binding IclR family transcriptional regulator